MTDELKDAHAEIARLQAKIAKYESGDVDPVRELLAGYYEILAGKAGAYPIDLNAMRTALKAHGWRRLREVTNDEIEHHADHYDSTFKDKVPFRRGIRRGIALARGEM